MDLLDAFIVLLVLIAIIRGFEIGFVRQFGSTIGLFSGLLLGAILQSHIIRSVHDQNLKALITVIVTLGCGFVVMSGAEYLAARIKHRMQRPIFNRADSTTGTILATASVLLFVWLGAAVLTAVPSQGLRTQIKDSRIISYLTDHLPATPNVIATLGQLVDPNGFPEVFSGHEPSPGSSSVAPSLAGFNAAITADKASVVKIEGQGCGGLVEGSGFVASNGLIATNAHVVAGIDRPYVVDSNGTHRATVVSFDPNLDFAVLRVGNLAGPPLDINPKIVSNDTKTAILGYPGGGPLTAGSGIILDEFIATGRNIYGTSRTERQIYEVQAHIIPGNSGGPMVTADGVVVGVVFAQSTSYKNVGYALTTRKVIAAVNQAKQQHSAVDTSNCAE